MKMKKQTTEIDCEHTFMRVDHDGDSKPEYFDGTDWIHVMINPDGDSECFFLLRPEEAEQLARALMWHAETIRKDRAKQQQVRERRRSK